MTVAPSPSALERFREQLEAIPVPPPEDSVLLRILVQILVSLGIIATDIAAGTWTSLWAIPLSIVGATWSWHHRRQRNITLKFILAVGMLTVLTVFLGQLLTQLNDSRLPLAQLLIQLQVLHSFDLPRRKDLGYSAIIGLILLGVGGTISQTLAFAPWLILFLLVSLPTLILDYRSRLNLEALSLKTWRLSRQTSKSAADYGALSPRRLLTILGVIMALALVLFALMPRFPSYQIQSFPVSGPEELKNEGFDADNQDIANPGYVKEGKGNKQGELGNNQSSGPGQVDSTYYYGFNQKMNQNLRGSMKPALVMRVRSQSAGFWRVLAFDRYTGQGWEISRDKQLQNIKRPAWSYRFFIAPSPYKMPTKEIVQSYSMAASLPNLLPALSHPQSVFFPSRELAMDPEGSVRSPGLLVDGLTYTVISEVPYRRRSLLNSAPTKYSESIQKHYLQMPQEIKEKVRAEAEKLLAKSPKPLTSAYEKALFLAQALKQNYQVLDDLPFFENQEDLVTAFLFRYQGGYGDHFATVLTIMLRSLGIPARLAVGFSPGQFNPFTGYYLVQNTDAHALTEVFFPDYGWFSFNPIPGHDLVPPSIDDPQAFSVLRAFWNWAASWLPSPVTAVISFLWSGIIKVFFGLFGQLWRFISGSFVGVLVGLIGATVAAFLSWLTWQNLGQWRDRQKLRRFPPMQRLYLQMLQLLGTKGYAKHPAQTPLEYASTTGELLPPSIGSLIAEISLAYSQWRYAQVSPNLGILQAKLQELRQLLGRTKLQNSSGDIGG